MGENDQKTSSEEAKRDAKWAAAEARELERHQAQMRQAAAHEADVKSIIEWRVIDNEHRARWVVACERQAAAMERNASAQEAQASALQKIAEALAAKVAP